jgi:hypothetical protein
MGLQALMVLLFCNDYVTGRKFDSVHLISSCVDWWGDVAAAARESLDYDTTTCLYDEVEVAPAMDKILARAAGETRTLIIGSTTSTGGHASFAKALATPGVVVLFIENAVDLAAYGLGTENVTMLQLRPDNPTGAMRTGAELCRIARYQDHNFAVIYGGTPSLDLRIDDALTSVARACPDTFFKVSFSILASPITP